ncbi:MAG: transcription factor S [Candidatus Woesearchaeota archaeon]
MKGKKVLACSCGYVAKDKQAGTIKEQINLSSKKIDIVRDEEKSILPRTSATCPKCGHETAYYWLVQTRAGDEPETKFLKCEKCETVWRDYN